MIPRTQNPILNSDLMYVCLHCGRCSGDLKGALSLSPGWTDTCSKKAVLLPSKDLLLNDQGRVISVCKETISKLKALVSPLD